jgi:hypothetical protein
MAVRNAWRLFLDLLASSPSGDRCARSQCGRPLEPGVFRSGPAVRWNQNSAVGSYPQLRINYGSTFPATTYTIDGSRAAVLELVIQFPDARLLRSPSCRRRGSYQRNPGLFPVEFTWDDLRHRWQCERMTATKQCTILSAGVRWQLEHREGPEHGEVAVSIRPGWMLPARSGPPLVPLRHRTIAPGLALFDQAQLTRRSASSSGGRLDPGSESAQAASAET